MTITPSVILARNCNANLQFHMYFIRFQHAVFCILRPLMQPAIIFYKENEIKKLSEDFPMHGSQAIYLIVSNMSKLVIQNLA